MTTRASKAFWREFRRLPFDIQRLAEKQFDLWLVDPQHPSLHFKPLKGGRWSARVGIHHRAMAVQVGSETFLWFWIGPHVTYDRLVS